MHQKEYVYCQNFLVDDTISFLLVCWDILFVSVVRRLPPMEMLLEPVGEMVVFTRNICCGCRKAQHEAKVWVEMKSGNIRIYEGMGRRSEALAISRY